jgi:hypothetical protein
MDVIKYDNVTSDREVAYDGRRHAEGEGDGGTDVVVRNPQPELCEPGPEGEHRISCIQKAFEVQQRPEACGLNFPGAFAS